MLKKSNAPFDYKKKFVEMEAWGLQTNVDIHGCHPGLIRDAAAIKDFVIRLCDLIEMKRFGETVIVNFGEDERVSGYSMTQLIETSLLSAHFANLSNTVYLDIFSCKYYDPYTASEFSKDFFKGKDCTINVVFRK
jgi:S-adenosylmethionine/arginine decarboxylase-like enzyme